MGELLTCPFCRELYSEDEGPECPDCALTLVPLKKLGLSALAQAEAEEWGDVDPPEDQTLPLLYGGRGRGTLSALSILGFGLFFQPWMTLLRPDPVSLSGYDLAISQAPWLWGGAIAWFLLLPLVLSRRTVNQLRGVRIIAVFFCVLTLGEVLLLLLRPPSEHVYFSSGLGYTWGIYASGLVSALAAIFGAQLGGSFEDLRDLPIESPPRSPEAGESLH